MTRPSDGPNPAQAPGVRLAGSPTHASGVRLGVSGAASGVSRLKKRADFLACAKGRKQHQRAFVLQGRSRDNLLDADGAKLVRVGFTVTKKTGNSVVRNRIRRRLREAIRLAGPDVAQAGCDYVLIGRREALAAPFPELRGEIDRAFRKIFLARPGAEPSNRAGDAAPPQRGQRRGRGASRAEPPAGGA